MISQYIRICAVGIILLAPIFIIHPQMAYASDLIKSPMDSVMIKEQKELFDLIVRAGRDGNVEEVKRLQQIAKTLWEGISPERNAIWAEHIRAVDLLEKGQRLTDRSQAVVNASLENLKK